MLAEILIHLRRTARSQVGYEHRVVVDESQRFLNAVMPVRVFYPNVEDNSGNLIRAHPGLPDVNDSARDIRVSEG